MPAWGWVWAAVAALFLLNGLRLRRRLAHLGVVAPCDDPVDLAHRFLVAEGVVVDDAARRAASGYARAHGLDVLDLVPDNLGVDAALDLLRAVQPNTYRSDPLAASRGAGAATLVAAGVLDRVARSPEAPPALADGGTPQGLADGGTPLAPPAAGTDTPLDEIAFFKALVILKRYAAKTADLAVVPGFSVSPARMSHRKAFLRGVLGPAFPLVFVLPLVQYAVVVLGLVVVPVWGGVALACFCVQPAIVTWGTPLRARDRYLVPPLRWLIAPLRLLRTAIGGWSPPPAPDEAAALRPVYAALLDGGTARFFEERRATCPLCSSGDLAVRVRTIDLLQNKPGRFVLDRCRACGHIFQNPRLSIDGLDFYYRDFYEGLGAEDTELIFGSSGRSYRGRAAMVEAAEGAPSPRRWMDVGTGHGHFCLVAKETWPQTRFDGLDMSESIEEAERRGWVTRGVRGQLIDRAPDLSGSYDVVSMHHYLEHTRDPRRELEAAASLLVPGGHLLIELPDPESWLGRLLGRYWLPWFQPQHQHLMPMQLLEDELVTRAFVIVGRERGPAHQAVDFTAAAWLMLRRLSPSLGRPWRPADGPIRRLVHKAVAAGGVPLLVTGVIIDNGLAPFIRRFGGSNTYRVLARYDGWVPGGGAGDGTGDRAAPGGG